MFGLKLPPRRNLLKLLSRVETGQQNLSPIKFRYDDNGAVARGIVHWNKWRAWHLTCQHEFNDLKEMLQERQDNF